MTADRSEREHHMRDEPMCSLERLHAIASEERVRDHADSGTVRWAAEEIERLRDVIVSEVAEIQGSHYPAADRPLCCMCGASDGGWPCTARMAADALEAAVSGRSEHPRVNP